MWSILNFGRYKDKMSLPQVVLHDPDYFFWASDSFAFRKRGFPEARDLARKARNIKIPKPDGEQWGVQYIFARGTNIFRGFKLVQGPVAVEIGETFAKILGEPLMQKLPRYLDLSVVYGAMRHDEIGNELLLRDFKFCFFGNERADLPREQCEAFFECDGNFCEPPLGLEQDAIYDQGTQSSSGLQPH
jgi:hypothetical protein